MGTVRLQQRTDGGVCFLLQPLSVEAAVVLIRLLGIRGQNLHLRHAFQHIHQAVNALAHDALRQYVQVAGLQNEIDQLAVGSTDAVLRDLVDAQELLGRGCFLLENAHGSCLHI